MQRSPTIFAVLGFLAAGLFSWLIAVSVVGRIESDTRQQTVTALAAAGQNWASAVPDGMQVILSGEAPDDAAKFEALEMLGKVIDGGRISDQTTVKSAVSADTPALSLEILRNAAQVSLIGLIPDEDPSNTLADTVATIVNSAPNVELLGEVAVPASKLWTNSVAFAMILLPMIERGNLRILPGKVELSAIAASDAARTKLQSDVMAVQPDNVTLTLDITAPLPVVSPFRFAMSLHDGVVAFSECSAETTQARARILSAVRRAGAAEMPKCGLALGSPSPTWPQAVDLAITGLEELGGGSLQFSDTDIVLTALTGADPLKLEQVRVDLQSALPQIFSLKAVLPVTLNQGAQIYRPLFSASLHADGSMTLSGALPDDASRAAVGTYAASLLEFGQVQNRVQVDPKLPIGWPARVLVGVETLAMLNSGTLTVSPDKIYIEGRGASPDIEAEVNDVLKAQLGEGQEFSTLVVTDPTLSQEIAPPANKECAAEVAAILAKKQISFAPSSGKIAEESLPVIDDIALVLKNCATARFEIGGHTDSKGGEVLNQALSQTRADAVLDALLARDVLIADMSARGYGESLPIGDNETEEGRAKNRRIAFKLLEGRDEPN